MHSIATASPNLDSINDQIERISTSLATSIFHQLKFQLGFLAELLKLSMDAQTYGMLSSSSMISPFSSGTSKSFLWYFHAQSINVLTGF